jgi:hypothetical protein
MYDEDYRDETGQIYDVALAVFLLLACLAALVIGGLFCGVVWFMVFP